MSVAAPFVWQTSPNVLRPPPPKMSSTGSLSRCAVRAASASRMRTNCRRRGAARGRSRDAQAGPVFQRDAAARSHMGEVADAEGWGHSTSTEAFPGVRRRRRERPRRPFAAVEPVEHFHQRRDRPDVALGDELASSALNLAKANPRLRPLHLVVRETEFCGLRLAGYFRRRMRENSRNSVRRPRCASLTRRNYGGFCLPGNRPGLSGLHGGGCRDQTDGHRSLASLQNEAARRGFRARNDLTQRMSKSLAGKPTRWRGRSRGFAFAKLSAEEASSSPRATSGRSRR